ncbi:MAG: Uma2 family endonuclease [Planctomycetota bacterium]
MTTTSRVPELRAGDHLTRDEFERRYAAMPDLKKAELIAGVVYMGSPVRCVQHGHPELALGFWLGCYRALTAGLSGAHNSTVRLDQDNEAQPDLVLRLPESHGGASRIATDGYLEGPPELAIEIAASSVSYDLHQKKDTYRRNGVQEYLVLRADDAEVDWFVLERGVYVSQVPDAEGILKSRVFPGLWLDVAALLRDDLAALRRTVERGCADPAHVAFAAGLPNP